MENYIECLKLYGVVMQMNCNEIVKKGSKKVVLNKIFYKINKKRRKKDEKNYNSKKNIYICKKIIKHTLIQTFLDNLLLTQFINLKFKEK